MDVETFRNGGSGIVKEDGNRSKRPEPGRRSFFFQTKEVKGSARPSTFSLWTKILVWANASVSLAAAATAVFAVALVGFPASGSVMAAWLLACLSLSASLLVVGFVWARAPRLAVPLAVCSYAVKTVMLGIVSVFAAPRFPYDKTWFAYSALGFVLLWQMSEIIVVIKNDDVLG